MITRIRTIGRGLRLLGRIVWNGSITTADVDTSEQDAAARKWFAEMDQQISKAFDRDLFDVLVNAPAEKQEARR